MIKDIFIGDFRKEEFKKTKKLLSTFDKDIKILDVGCGYGRKITLLQSLGYKNILGVEKNEIVVDKVKSIGLKVVTLDEFERLDNHDYDLIIMSHIIEHFDYEALKYFMEYYLKLLKKDGYLFISTPMLDKTFYTNFDHVKPYLPDSIRNVFEDDTTQMQFYSKERLRLVDIEFRKTPLSLKFFKSIYLNKPHILLKSINLILTILFKISFGLIGTTNGWLGLYKKCS